MTLAEWKSEIISGNIRPIYLVVGEEIGIINIYLNQLASRISLEISRKETVKDGLDEINNSGLFMSEDKVYVVRADKEFQKTESAWNVHLGKSKLILLYDKIDSRQKFFKHFANCTVKIDKLDREVLVRYIMQGTEITSKYATGLAILCNDSYDVAMLERDKALTYAAWRHIKPDTSIKRLVEDGTICGVASADVFQFVDAVCLHQSESAYEIASDLQNEGVPALSILGALYTSMKAVMLMQSCKHPNVAETTGLDKGAIYYSRPRLNKYTIPHLVCSITLIADIIDGIKNGKIADTHAVDYALSYIL